MELIQRRRRAAARLAPAAVCLALLAGCASPEPTAQGPHTTRAAAGPSPTGPGRSDYTYRLPLAVYSYSDAEYEVIESAQQILARDCMKGFGLSYRPAKKSAPGATSDRRYGISDMADAARYGYHLPPQPRDPEPKLGADQRRVLYGNRDGSAGKRGKLEFRGKAVPNTGCLGSAVRQLARPHEYPAGVTAASNISSGGFSDSMRDSGVEALFAHWSACMKENGYDYASPLEPFRNPAFTDGRVTAEEKATAAADMACKRRTNHLESWLKAETGIQRRMIRNRIAVLRRLKTLHAQKVSAARKIIAGA
ncbi:hypothetical protein [Streptomyces sp. NPDC007905]|uniref:hypothetical protein n=1 Tax=Streptomyces sp. NPDC007905 TaxID=3364788 RepID=UPI0036E7372F